MRLSKSVLLPLAVAVVAGGAAFILLGRLTATEEVVVAARDLRPMSIISESCVKLVSMPQQSVHPKACSTLETIMDMRVLGPISAGQQIIATSLSKPGEGFGQWTGTNRVVMFVPMAVNRWLGGGITPGDVVDLVFCTNPQKTGVNLSKTVLAAVTVASTMGASPKWDQSMSEPAGLSLVLTAHEAELLAFCLENGSLYACLSSDGSTKSSDGVSIETIMEPPIDRLWDW